MKKSKFFAIASLAMAITSCGGNTSDQNETKSPELDVVTMSRAESESTDTGYTFITCQRYFSRHGAN